MSLYMGQVQLDGGAPFPQLQKGGEQAADGTFANLLALFGGADPGAAPADGEARALDGLLAMLQLNGGERDITATLESLLARLQAVQESRDTASGELFQSLAMLLTVMLDAANDALPAGGPRQQLPTDSRRQQLVRLLDRNPLWAVRGDNVSAPVETAAAAEEKTGQTRMPEGLAKAFERLGISAEKVEEISVVLRQLQRHGGKTDYSAAVKTAVHLLEAAGRQLNGKELRKFGTNVAGKAVPEVSNDVRVQALPAAQQAGPREKSDEEKSFSSSSRQEQQLMQPVTVRGSDEHNAVKGMTAMFRPHQTMANGKEQIFRQLVQKFQLSRSLGKQEMRVQLKPEYLGKVSIKVEHTDQGLIARIVVEHQSVKDAVWHNLPQLKSVLQDQGIKLEQAVVSLEEHGGQDGQFQFAGQGDTGRQNGRRYGARSDGTAETQEIAASRFGTKGLVDYLA